MFWRILKKDLKHKKGINFILFLFMILATMFVASSINNILVVMNATNYCMEKGKVPDIYIDTYTKTGEDSSITKWMDSDGKKYYKDYSVNESLVITQGNIVSFDGKDGSKYDIANTIIIQREWKKNMLIFDTDGNEVSVEDGHIAMQKCEMERNKLREGDKLTLKIGKVEKAFIIDEAVMDPAFGGDFIGMTRYVLSDSDYEKLAKEEKMVCSNYCINTDDSSKFMKEFNKQGFNIIINIDGKMFGFAYVIKMITAGILIIVGVCLIIISFLVLKFTITFTLQEDYKEIGIMKAIGIRNKGIRKIYMIKYLMLIAVAAVIGCILSIPASNFMLKSVAKNMMTENGSANILVNILSSIGVMALVMLICFLSTNRLRRFTAIEAIRSGETGERFRRKTFFPLHKRKRMCMPLYLAVNDILSNIRRYIVLILTFAVGTIIIILPINTITSMNSDEMAVNFAMDLKADLYVDADSNGEEIEDSLNDRSHVENNIKKLHSALKDEGYEADINTLIFYSMGMYAEDKNDILQAVAIQPYNTDGSFIELTKGKTPELENEMSMSEILMKELGVDVGDTVHIVLNGVDYTFIITGSYQNFIQMGKSAMLSEKFALNETTITGTWYMQCYMKNSHDNNLSDTLAKKLPQYKFYNKKEAMEQSLGSSISELSSVKYLIVILICGVNLLITVLMMKIFILGEKSQIAMLRSIGYSNRTLRWWQVLRMSIILIVSEIIGILLSTVLNNIAIRPIFGMMGATHMHIVVNPLEVYLAYPLLLLAVIIIAAIISSAKIKKLNVMEINNLE